jgi:hypothetical protein
MPARVSGARANLPGYAYDSRLRGYGYVDLTTGRFVSKATIHGLLQDQADRSAATLGELARLATEGTITPRQFYEAMRNEVKLAYNVDCALARGGWAQVTPADWRKNGGHLKDEYRRLRDFAQDIADGKLTEKQAVARAKLYADSAYKRYWEIQKEEQAKAEMDEEHWQTVGDENVCPVCRGLEYLGWVPLGTLPLPGDPHNGCRCEKEWRKAPAEQAVAVDWGRIREFVQVTL